MQPYEIRQRSDGSIDYSHYYARPVSLMPHLRRFSPTAVSPKMWLAMAVTLAALALTPALAVERTVAHFQTSAATSAQIGERQAASFKSAQALHARMEVLANSDPRKWWDGYGKSTSRSQSAAIAELQRQLDKTRAVMAARGLPMAQ